jgi:ring-1,2-phenylacetyl-CoA epoxidase subunit PaaD
MSEFIPLVSAAYSQRLSRRIASSVSDVWGLLDQVKDPEIPALSIWDLGVLTDIEEQDGQLEVSITPTYSGCPAMEAIRDDILKVLTEAGYPEARVRLVLAPAWTTDWMSPEGRTKLQEYGIAPPQNCGCAQAVQVACPHCGSDNTTTISEFGSTACKALYQCRDCSEPFDYFKQH